MSDASRELAIYAMNNADLYRQRTLPVLDNLAKHMRKGRYDPERAVAGMMHVTTDAAKRYHAEFCIDGTWHSMFSVADRREAAEELLAHYSEDIRERAA